MEEAPIRGLNQRAQRFRSAMNMLFRPAQKEERGGDPANIGAERLQACQFQDRKAQPVAENLAGVLREGSQGWPRATSLLEVETGHMLFDLGVAQTQARADGSHDARGKTPPAAQDLRQG